MSKYMYMRMGTSVSLFIIRQRRTVSDRILLAHWEPPS